MSAECGCRIVVTNPQDGLERPGIFWANILYCPLHQAAGQMKRGLTSGVGFCITLREDHPCGAQHQDAGLLFADATAALTAAELWVGGQGVGWFDQLVSKEPEGEDWVSAWKP
mgnify:FL=1